jgi:phosphatidylserine decarboxylase
VARGTRIGLIRFGSRVDVLVPSEAYSFSVKPGMHVRAGSSSLGVRTP